MTILSASHQVLLLALLATNAVEAFTVHASSRSVKMSSLEAQKSICTFDKDDFALATGEWPYTEADMTRLDSSDDSRFYDAPRFVTHIDDRAIESLTNFYREELAALALRKKDGNIDVLDLCSSWISHLPDINADVIPFGRVVGVGMNEQELAANEQLTEYYVQDMNVDPSLSRFEDNSFDVICNVVSVDYLTQPREIFQEMHRILRPGGIALMSFSNRCFATKAVNMWLQADDIGRMTIVASYFHYTAPWASIEAVDIIPAKMNAPERPNVSDIFANPAKGWAWMSTVGAVNKANSGDPMFVVKAEK
jgi:SAM-dependent methyltransferase